MGFSFVLCMFCLCFQGPTEKDQIDVQGDIMYDLAEFITETWQNVGSLSSTHLVPCPLLFCRPL